MADAAPPAAALEGHAPAPASFDAATALKDAALAALVAFGLSIPILALRTEQGPGTDLILLPRWGLVATICAIVFAGSFLLRLAGFHRPSARRARSRKDAITTITPEEAARQGGWRHWLGVAAVPLFLGIALTFPVIAWFTSGGLSESRYWVDLATLILTYVMLGWGLNIVVGLAGLLDLGYVAFYAVGAYSYALLSTSEPIQAWMEAHVGAGFWPLWAFWFCLPVCGILAAFWGILLGFPVLRLRGDYLAIVTLAFGEIIRLVLINWVELTNGGAGISGIPRATFFGIPFTGNEDGFAARFGIEYDPMHRLIFLYYLILVLALLTNWVTLRVRRLPLGRAWEALREDEIACRALGINTRNTKLTAFAMGAMFGGFAGAFFAVRQAFVSPESFNFLESATILAIVVLGGMGSQIGVAVAAIAVVAGPELLRNLGFLQAIFGEGFDPNEYRLLLFGLAMVGMMIWRPRGLISQRNPSAVLKERKAVAGSFVGEGHG